MPFQIPAHIKPKDCPEADCSESFYTDRMLNMHVRVIHRREPCHFCPHCAGPFGHVADLNDHILLAHDRNNMPQKCAECVCAFNSVFSLRQHIETAHRRKQIKCKKCDYSSVHAGAIERHELDEHDIKPAKEPEKDRELTFSEKKERTIGYIVIPRNV